jgi:hypothetical protein
VNVFMSTGRANFDVNMVVSLYGEMSERFVSLSACQAGDSYGTTVVL